MYTNAKVLGPYYRKDGRQHVIVRFDGEEYRTVSYPKFLMENHLDRFLKENEPVDHIDRDFTNNVITNLRVIDRKKHAQSDAYHLQPQTFICPICNDEFTKSGTAPIIIQNRKKRKSGPFCCRSCAGKHNAMVQHHNKQPAEVAMTSPQYYRPEKLLHQHNREVTK